MKPLNSAKPVKPAPQGHSTSSTLDHGGIPYKQELLRKGIHLASLTIPIIYAFIPRQTALMLLLGLFVPALLIDVLRYRIPALSNWVRRFWGSMMRPHELDASRHLLSGATYVLLSAILCVAIFPKIIAITAFSVLIVADICSALVGRKFGTIPFFDKSLQGSAAFVLAAWAVVAAIWGLTSAPLLYAAIAAVASVVGAVAEAASTRLRLDDNFSIPLAVGTIMWALTLVFAPSLAVLL
jgi:dolichol kinase